MSNNNNNSDRIYIILGVLVFLCVMSSGAALLIRYITKSDTSKKSLAPVPAPVPTPAPSQPVSNSPNCNLAAARVCGDAVGKATEDAVFCCRNNNCDDDCQW